MNFLFTTVLVLLLVAPGLAFFRAYHSGKFSIRYSNLTLTDQVFRSIAPGLTVQVLLFWLINNFEIFPYKVKLDTLGLLLLGAKEDKSTRDVFNSISSHLGLILLYYISTVILGVLSGWGLRRFIRWQKLDRRFLWLRYDNRWYYLLSGELVETPEAPEELKLKDAKHIDFVFVDILVKLEKSNVLYSGILGGYDLGQDGGLDNVHLIGCQRKNLTQHNLEDEEVQLTTNEYYPVAGDLLIIPYVQMLNINITYWIDEEDARVEGDVPEEALKQMTRVIITANDIEDSV